MCSDARSHLLGTGESWAREGPPAQWGGGTAHTQLGAVWGGLPWGVPVVFPALPRLVGGGYMGQPLYPPPLGICHISAHPTWPNQTWSSSPSHRAGGCRVEGAVTPSPPWPTVNPTLSPTVQSPCPAPWSPAAGSTRPCWELCSRRSSGWPPRDSVTWQGWRRRRWCRCRRPSGRKQRGWG